MNGRETCRKANIFSPWREKNQIKSTKLTDKELESCSSFCGCWCCCWLVLKWFGCRGGSGGNGVDFLTPRLVTLPGVVGAALVGVVASLCWWFRWHIEGSTRHTWALRSNGIWPRLLRPSDPNGEGTVIKGLKKVTKFASYHQLLLKSSGNSSSSLTAPVTQLFSLWTMQILPDLYTFGQNNL